MARTPRVIQNVAALRKAVSTYRKAGDKVALVPTMGALHDGHMSLVAAAKTKAKRVIVSIFVNPEQFAPTEDFSTYPRTMDTDLAKLRRLEVDAVWAPDKDVMYPEGFSTRIAPGGPAYAGLEDAFRPHFFGGVATVVSKLFLQTTPDFAFFGEKDYQQLKVVTRMAADLDIPVQILGVPTVREEDGLALSSRNVYLASGERKIAPTLHQTLLDCAMRIKKGQPLQRVMADGGQALTAAGFVLDYLEARNADSLEPVTNAKQGPLRLLVAARLGTTRLIDNIAV
jgi:pantoate--beta-alanine ligase